MSFRDHWRLQLAGLWLAAALAPAAQADVWGKLTDAASGQPFPVDSMPFIVLNRCANPGDQLCAEFTAAFNPEADGRYRFPADLLAPGTYQVSGWADAFQYTYSPTFTVAGNEHHEVDVALNRMPLAIGNVQGCTSLEAGGYCTVQYTLSNIGSSALPLQAWVMASAVSDAPAGWSQYESGDGQPKPVDVTLAAGESRTLSQRVYVGQNVPAGAYTSLELLVAPAGKPQRTLVWYGLPEVLFGSNGSIRLEPRPLAKRKAMAAQKKIAQLGAGATDAAAADRTLFIGRVIGSDTRAPLPVADKPQVQLLRCELPTDTYCRWLQTDPATLQEDGRFTARLSGAPAGRYQFHAVAGSHYGQALSPVFDLPGQKSGLIQLVMPRNAVDLDSVVRCENAPAAACSLVYTLRNTTKRDLDVQLWLYLYGVTSEAQTGQPTYAIGQGSGGDGQAHGLPVRRSIAAGQTIEWAQTVDLSGLPTGSAGWLRLFVAPADDVTKALAYFPVGNYSVFAGADGAPRVTVIPRPDIAIGRPAAPANKISKTTR